MDISSTISFIVGILIALAAGYVGWQDWQKSTYEKRLAIVQRVVLSIEEYVKREPHKVPGADKLLMVMERLDDLFPGGDKVELDEMVHAEVAKLNALKQAGPQSRGGHWTN